MSEAGVFIVGTPFCGSTLLGTALNQHPDVLYTGEIGYLPAYHRELFEEEPSWDPLCLGCGLNGASCSLWTPEVLEKCQAVGVAEVHDYVRTLTGAPIVVDGSKYPAWLKLCLLKRMGRALPKVILSVRNPYAYMNSAKRYHQAAALHSAKTWRDVYWDTLCTCATLNIDHLIVRHEDFMLQRKRTVRRVCDFLGIDPAPAMYAKSYPAGRCSIGGNPGVSAVGCQPEDQKVGNLPLQPLHYSRSGHGRLDTRWKEELSAGEIRDALYASGLADTAALLGYNLISLALEQAAAQNSAA